MSRRQKRPEVDRHLLYQAAVQAPEADIEIFTEVFSRHRGRPPMALREDFCGTALLSCEWARSRAGRTALAIDLDRATLAWGREHNLAAGGGDLSDRVRLVEADVREVRRPRVDLACAMNFSFCTLKRRRELLDYFRTARAGLRDDGILILELYGGTEAIVALEERRQVEDFVYVWEQESFNPITHETRCHIHFELPGGRRLERAFTYDWRLWTIPELRDALTEAGFATVEVYWEQVDDAGEGTGEYRRTDREENQEGWLVYVAGLK